VPGAADFDENGHVNNVVYLAWAQEIAIAHWRARAPAPDQDLWAWIALRHEVDYRRQLLPGEKALARTWTADAAEGPRLDRFIRIDAADGTMCAQVKTTWVLIERATGRPKRVPGRLVEAFG